MLIGSDPKFNSSVSTTLLFVIALVSGRASLGQTCPVAIEKIEQQTISTQMGMGIGLRVAYTNNTKFRVRAIEFGVQAFDPTKKVPGRPRKIFSYRDLAPGQSGVLIWNATQFDRRNLSKPEIIVWPAVVELGDGSRWLGKATTCGIRFDGGLTVDGNATKEVAPTATAAKAQRQEYSHPFA